MLLSTQNLQPIGLLGCKVQGSAARMPAQTLHRALRHAVREWLGGSALRLQSCPDAWTLQEYGVKAESAARSPPAKEPRWQAHRHGRAWHTQPWLAGWVLGKLLPGALQHAWPLPNPEVKVPEGAGEPLRSKPWCIRHAASCLQGLHLQISAVHGLCADC